MKTGFTRTALLAACLLAGSAACARRPAGPNIVLVVLDTVRRDYTGLGGGTSFTPCLDALAADGTAFANAWANAPWTPPSHASLFTGLLPSAHGCDAPHTILDTPAPTLAEWLGRSGYETVAFYSNPMLTDGASRMMRGFQTQHVSKVLGMSVMEAGAQGGPETVRNIAQWMGMRRAGKPFFVFVNFLEAHLPYDPPEDYRKAHLADLPEDDIVTVRWADEFNAQLHPPRRVNWDRVRRLYAGDVHTADQLLGQLIDLLKRHDLYDDTVVIVTSDHGENLGEHDRMEHQYGVYETLLAVPLVVRAPGRLAAGRRTDPAMLTDVFATVLDLAGVPNGDLPPHSRSLLSPTAGTNCTTIAEYSGGSFELLNKLRTINPKLDTRSLELSYTTAREGIIRLTVAGDGSEAVHDLGSDPGQLKDLAPSDAPEVGHLRQILQSLEKDRRSDVRKNVEMNGDLKRQLRSLGYAQ